MRNLHCKDLGGGWGESFLLGVILVCGLLPFRLIFLKYSSTVRKEQGRELLGIALESCLWLFIHLSTMFNFLSFFIFLALSSQLDI